MTVGASAAVQTFALVTPGENKEAADENEHGAVYHQLERHQIIQFIQDRYLRTRVLSG